MYVALAPPISLIGQKDSPVLNFLTNKATVSLVVNSHKMIGSHEYYPANWAVSGCFKIMCALAYDVCQLLENLVADTDSALNNPIASKVYFAHYPSGSSMKTAEHFS